MTAGNSMGGRAVGRPRGRKHAEVRRRTHRLAPGVIGLCLVMVLATFVFLILPSPVAADPLKICQQCPNNPSQCEPNCGSGGGGGAWLPPYTSGTSWSSTRCPAWPYPCATNSIYANTENQATGYVSDAVESSASILEAGSADAWVQFNQYIGHPSKTGTYTIDFAWDISWSVSADAVCVPPYGGSTAVASVTLGGNGYNENGYFIHNGDAENTLQSAQTSCPGVPLATGGSGGFAKEYDVTFSAYLVSTDTFTFYTWVHVSEVVAGAGLGTADGQAWVTWGTGTSSYSWWMSYQ